MLEPSPNDGTTRYAVGLPGKLARLFLDDRAGSIARQLLDGEVAVAVDDTTCTLITDDGLRVLPAPPPPIEARRAARKAEARAVRQAAEDGLCATPLGVIQTPPASRLNIAGLVSLALIAKASAAPFRQPFRMADNEMVDHDADQMIALGVAVGRHVAACNASCFAIADAIAASDDPAAIDITAGYPAPAGASA